MSTATLNDTEVVTEQNGWISDRQGEIDNEIVDAFEKGIEKGIEKGQQELKKRMLEHILKQMKRLEKAQSSCEKMWRHLDRKGFEPVGLYLKATNMTAFEGLFLISKDKIERLESEGIYQKIDGLTAHLSRRDFDIDMVFVPYTEHFDIRTIQSDGFHFTYGKSRKL